MKTIRPLEERPVIVTNSSLRPAIPDGLSLEHLQKRVRISSLLSIIPGLGQIYNGEFFKGCLFLSIYVINLFVFLSLLFKQQVVGIFTQGNIQNTYLAKALQVLNEAQIGNVFLLAYFGAIVAFIIYAIKDAYQNARLKAFPKSNQSSLPAATSGSYLFHLAIILSGALMILFANQPKEEVEQIMNIELTMPQKEAPKVAKVSGPQMKKDEIKPPKEEVQQKIQTIKPQELANQTPVLPVAPVVPTPSATDSKSPASSTGEPSSQTGSGGEQGNASGQNVDFGPYLAEIQKRIKKAWIPPRGNESKRITVKFKVHKDGVVTSVRLEKSSGLTVADDAALEAVEKASPFPPLPTGVNDIVTIRFTFDYNVFNGGRGEGLNLSSQNNIK